MSSFEAVSHFCSINGHVSGGNHACTRRTPCRLLVRIKGTCSNLIKAQLKQDALFMFARKRETKFCCTWYVQKALHAVVNCISRRDCKTLSCSNPVKCRLWKDWWFSRPNLKQLRMDARFSNSERLCSARYWPVDYLWHHMAPFWCCFVSFSCWFCANNFFQQTKIKRVQLLYHFAHKCT